MATQFHIMHETRDDESQCVVYATELGAPPDADGRRDYWIFGPPPGQIVKLHATKDEVMEAESLPLDTASLASHLTVFRVALDNASD